jgi:hypothetical protein
MHAQLGMSEFPQVRVDSHGFAVAMSDFAWFLVVVSDLDQARLFVPGRPVGPRKPHAERLCWLYAARVGRGSTSQHTTRPRPGCTGGASSPSEGQPSSVSEASSASGSGFAERASSQAWKRLRRPETSFAVKE